VSSVEAKLDEILSRLERLETGQQRLETAQQRLETAQQGIEAGQQRLEVGQQDLWAAVNAHARRTSERFDELQGGIDRGFARVQGQVQEVLNRVERQDERAGSAGT
jgi:exonuclease VII small subunit